MSLVSIHEKLKVYASFALVSIVLDVLRPRLALDVDEHAGRRLGKVHEDEGREVAGLVAVREVSHFDALGGVVVQRADRLLVGGVLSGKRMEWLARTSETIENKPLPRK